MMPIFFDPLFSILVDCRDPEHEDLSDLLESLAQQSYRNFEVIIAGPHPRKEDFVPLTGSRGVFVEPIRDIPSILEDAEQRSYRGDFLIVLRPSDKLFPDALERIVETLSLSVTDQTSLIVIFDHTVGTGSRGRYLPGWDPDLLEHVDYIQNACCLSRDFLLAMAGVKPHKSLHERLLLGAEMKAEVLHVRGFLAQLSYPEPLVSQMQRKQDGVSSLSIIVPSRNGLALLTKCLEVLKTINIPFELILVDNASDDEAVLSLYEDLKGLYDVCVVPFERSFNYSAMINRGAARAKNEVLLLLNNDVFINTRDTVELAVDYAMRPSVGVVGSVLYYPDGSVQHAGMVLSRPSADDFDTSHVLRFSKGDEGDFIGALTAPRNWQSVTGAFQVVRKSVFEAAGGYDELNFPTEFNDVDFCLRVRTLGLRVVCLPFTGVIHAESSTRSKQTAALAERLFDDAYRVMRERWSSAYENDPFLNPGTSSRTSAIERSETFLGSLSGRAVGALDRLLARALGFREQPSQEQVNSVAKIRSRMPRALREGICLVGPFGSGNAAGVQSRRLFTTCDEARIPVSVIDTATQRDTCLTKLPEASLPISDRKISICISNPLDVAKALPAMGEGRVRVAYPYLFEPSAASQVSLDLLRGFDEVWVPSAFAADIVRERLGREVRLVPPPLIVDGIRPASSDGSEELRIVTCFDSRFEDQQDPLGAIKVFKAAFPVARDVRFEVIWRGRPSAEFQSSLLKVIGVDDRISITSVPEHEASTALDRTKSQVLISLHRTDVPPFDIANALMRNMIVLASDWGHSTDLLTSSTGFPIPCVRKATGVTDQKSERDVWVEPDFDFAVGELRQISQSYSSAHLRGCAGREFMLREYSQVTVGLGLRRVLNAMTSQYSLD